MLEMSKSYGGFVLFEKLTVRAARATEFETVADITVRAYQAVPGLIDDDTNYYVEELRDVAGRARSSDILVAVNDDDKILGAIAYVPDSMSEMAEWDMPDVAGFRMLAVDPSAQGLGVGQFLTETCLERAREGGAKALVLHTLEALTAARGLYSKMGFQRDASFDVDLVHAVLLGYRYDL